MTSQPEDTLQRFLIENCSVRGARVQLRQSFQDIANLHTCSTTAAHVLGESIAAAALLASTIKLEGRLALQARGEGPLKLLVAECTNHGGVRGIIELDDSMTRDNHDMNELLQKGYLAVTLLPDNGESYQGLVPLEGSRLQDCLSAYFAQSEQIPTMLWLACDGECAAGLLLQVLPDHDNNHNNNDDWQRVCLLANTLSNDELLHLPHEQLLHRLFHEDTVRMFKPTAIGFSCTCSHDRSRNALALLGRDELQKLFAERDIVEVDCQFCRQQYCYTEQDMRDVLGKHSNHIH